VVFDAVGTLIHPTPSAPVVYAEVGKRLGSKLNAEQIRTRFIAAFRSEEDRDRNAGWRTSEAREQERWRHVVRATLADVDNYEACFVELFQHFSRPDAWRCLPETRTVLEMLQARGYLRGLASNYDSRLKTVVAGKPELQAINRVVISAAVGWRKPSEAFFAAVCQTMQCPAAKILYVGDDPGNDYAGASAAGLKALLFDPKGIVGSKETSIQTLSQVLEFAP
jgi:putative hydrolase of the HAD superfamily